MSEEMQTMDDFKNELEKSFRVVKSGDMVSGTIVDINEDGVTLDIGYFAQGVISNDELSDDPAFRPMFDLKIGDELSAVVLDNDDGKGNVALSLKEANQVLSWDKLRDLFENQTKIKVKIDSAVNAGVVTYLEGIRAFIPASQLSVNYVENLEEWVGRTVEAVVITVDEQKQKLVLSAKAIEMEKVQADRERKVLSVKTGMIMKGKVDSMQPYGAFVTLENGLSGLVHISNICMKRIKKPQEVLKLGQEVEVKVIEIKNGKIGLSIKDVENNTSDIATEYVDDAPTSYEDKDDAPNNPFAALLKGIKLD